MIGTPTKTITHGDGAKKDLAIITNGFVANKLTIPDEWAEKDWSKLVPEGATAVVSAACHIGDEYRDGKFYRKVVWNDEDGNSIPDFEIEIDNPPAEVLPIKAMANQLEAKGHTDLATQMLAAKTPSEADAILATARSRPKVSEIDLLKADNERLKAALDVLLAKGQLTEAEITAQVKIK